MKAKQTPQETGAGWRRGSGLGQFQVRRHKGACTFQLHHQGAARVKRHSYFISLFGSTAAI